MDVIHVSCAGDAAHLRDHGYCPIECSFGGVSVVDDLNLDHHGDLAHLEPVSIRAYRDYPCWRTLDPRFVVTGAADADATFAIAALAGFLPHPRIRIEHTSPTECRLTRNETWAETDPDLVRIMPVARTVAQADVDPFSERWEESDPGLLLLAYKQKMQGKSDGVEAFRTGAELWRELVQTVPRKMLGSVRATERDRVQRARSAEVQMLHPDMAFVTSPVWGWDVWYSEMAPVIFAYQTASGRCSIGCRSETLARHNFGPRGLLAIAELLNPLGWGGRTTIIGSPRGVFMSREQALAAARAVANLLKAHFKPN